jgi:catechol 2,3-dioxygenase-like lactoylglutathione lyase family enzyme
MPLAKLALAALLLMIAASLASIPAQSQAPVLPAAKVTADNPLGLTIDHATLSVKEIDKEEKFYEEMLGFKELSTGNFGPDVKFRTLAIPGVFRLDLVEHKGSSRHAPLGTFDMEQGWVHLVFKSSNLDAAYKTLLAKKTTIRVTQSPDGSFTEFFLIDPEGNEIELQR